MKHLKLLSLLLLPFSLQAGEWQYFPFADQYRRVCCAGDEVFMLRGNRLIQANGRQWSFDHELNRLSGLSGNAISDISYSLDVSKLAIVYENGMIDLLRNDGTLSCITDLKEATIEGLSKHINHVSEGEGVLCISTDFGFLVVDLDQEYIRDCFTLGEPVTCTWIEDSHYFYHTQSGQTYTCGIKANLFNPNNWSPSDALPPTPSIPSGAVDQCASVTGDTIYTLYPDQGLVSNLHTDPLPVEEYQMGSNNNRLHFAHGILATCHVSDLMYTDYVTNLTTQGYLSEYLPDTRQWSNMNHYAVTNRLGERKTFGGIIDMISDPVTPRRYYYSSLENGIYVIQDGKFEARWDNFDGTSLIEAFTGNSARVGGLAFSPELDFWYVNEGVDQLLRVRTHDGQWYKFTIDAAKGQVGIPHLIHSVRKHILWGCKTTGYRKCFAFAYDYAGTVADTSDDRNATVSQFIDEAGRTIQPNYFYNVAEGPDGSIWLLTTSGIYVIDDPDQIFAAGSLHVRTAFDAMLAFELLFDNEGRIWIATTSDGIYLYDPSGRQMLQHFTTENCLLTSNEVLTLDFEPHSNTLWISCTGAILSYQYGEFEYGAGSSGSAVCFPHTIQTSGNDPVNIIGLKDHSAISIRNAEGEEVYTTTVVGGTVTIAPGQLPIGHYTITGIDRQGQYGLIDTFTIK